MLASNLLAEYQSTVHDEAGFFERVDKEIYKFVEEVKRKLDSVQKEREICGKFKLSYHLSSKDHP